MSHNIILEILEEHGFSARLVGGCVRDQLLNRRPKDIDIVTDAPPGDIVEILSSYKLVRVGESFGVIKVILSENEEIDVATLRSEEDYVDGRRPENVQFVACFKQDAQRRDFTINALSKCRKGNIFDYFQGQSDLQNGIIRTVGDPQERLQEDYLRMLRAVRFAAQLNFRIENWTWKAIQANASRISKVSAERIQEELRKLLLSCNPAYGLQLLKDSGLLQVIIPEFEATWSDKGKQSLVHHPEGDVFTHTKLVVNALRKSNFVLLMGGLLHDIGKPNTQEIHECGKISNNGHAEVGAEIAEVVCRRLKLSNEETSQIIDLVKLHMKMHVVSEMKKSSLIKLLKREDIENLKRLQHADSLGSLNESKSMKSFIEEKQKQFHALVHIPPFISGSDLIAIGLKPGPGFKRILGEVRDLQLEEKIVSREQAIEHVSSKFLK